MDVTNKILNERRHTLKVHIQWYHLYKVQKEAKQIFDDENQNSDYVWGSDFWET